MAPDANADVKHNAGLPLQRPSPSLHLSWTLAAWVLAVIFMIAKAFNKRLGISLSAPGALEASQRAVVGEMAYCGRRSLPPMVCLCNCANRIVHRSVGNRGRILRNWSSERGVA
ncbi:MAG: hypothetical protein J2P50_07375 [Hyphomicrobiaceae bacterium]|nr:hypothetical protein [Hyphomicrobiaceae bacterium]